MKALVFDIETTGVKHWRNGIHQIAGIIEIEGEVKEDFNLYCAPNPGCDIEQEALDLRQLTPEIVNSYPPMQEVYLKFTDMLSKYVDKFNKKDKMFLIGYNNASFDNNFLRAWFVQNGDNYFGSWFWSSWIDVMGLAAEHLKNERADMVDFKLRTVAEKLGLEPDESKLHDALYDVHLTRRMYHKITRTIK